MSDLVLDEQEEFERLLAEGYYEEFNVVPTEDDPVYEDRCGTRQLSFRFWGPRSHKKDIDPERYRGTRLYWHTLEEYRALNPRGPE